MRHQFRRGGLKLIFLLAQGSPSVALFHHILLTYFWCDKGNSTLMDDLEVLQNKAARIILDFRPQAHLLVML